MYLIRAGAMQKWVKTAAALEDVNLIRQRAGLSGEQTLQHREPGDEKQPWM